MSQQTVREFFAKAASDEQLLNRLKESDDLASIVRVAEGEGYRFSVADLEAVNPPPRTGDPAGSQLQPPGADVMACSQYRCNYTSYASKCVNSIPQKQDA